MQTNARTFGSVARICSTIPAYALWNSRHAQSNASSTKRFSAASLRGFTGHQTAPAREMPNTHANAVASLLDSTATLSPTAMPALRNARATRWLMRWTSVYDQSAQSIVKHGACAPSCAPLSR